MYVPTAQPTGPREPPRQIFDQDKDNYGVSKLDLRSTCICQLFETYLSWIITCEESSSGAKDMVILGADQATELEVLAALQKNGFTETGNLRNVYRNPSPGLSREQSSAADVTSLVDDSEEDFVYGFHVFPDNSIGHLQLHVFPHDDPFRQLVQQAQTPSR